MPAKKTTEAFINEAKNTHGDLYDYSLSQYKNSKTKIKIICSTHGEFEQNPGDHIYGRGCNACAKEYRANGMRKTMSTFMDEMNTLHNNKYDYSKAVYKNNKIPIIIICPLHGEFNQRPDMHLRGSGCTVPTFITK
jgi:hypothetical protein